MRDAEIAGLHVRFARVLEDYTIAALLLGFIQSLIGSLYRASQTAP